MLSRRPVPLEMAQGQVARDRSHRMEGTGVRDEVSHLQVPGPVLGTVSLVSRQLTVLGGREITVRGEGAERSYRDTGEGAGRTRTARKGTGPCKDRRILSQLWHPQLTPPSTRGTSSRRRTRLPKAPLLSRPVLGQAKTHRSTPRHLHIRSLSRTISHHRHDSHSSLPRATSRGPTLSTPTRNHPKVTHFPVQHHHRPRTMSATPLLSLKAIQHLRCHPTHIPTQRRPFLGHPISTLSGEGLGPHTHSSDPVREAATKHHGQGEIQVAQNGGRPT